MPARCDEAVFSEQTVRADPNVAEYDRSVLDRRVVGDPYAAAARRGEFDLPAEENVVAELDPARWRRISVEDGEPRRRIDRSCAIESDDPIAMRDYRRAGQRRQRNAPQYGTQSP